MNQGQFSKRLLAPGGDFQNDVAPVLVILALSDHAARFKPARKFDGTVMTEVQSPGDVSDGGPQTFREAFQREQKLVLLRAKALRLRCLFTEMKKPADLISKFGQRPEIIGR